MNRRRLHPAYARIARPAKPRVRRSSALAAVVAFAALAAAPAHVVAQQVLSGDPVDPATGLAYPILPGVPLFLPGDDEEFGTSDDILQTGTVGDVDLVVRVGTVVSAAVPPPSLAPGGPALASVVAGGGVSGQGGETAFSVLASDGSGSPPYGNVVASSDLDLRPATVYAFADLDGDGVIGPSSADGAADDAFELQEITAYAGRQMGTLESGRFLDSLGIEMAAPASLGALRVSLSAGAWTGDDPETLFTDGPFILTRWPLFPPLDPKDLLGGGNNPSPDPATPSELEWDIERNYRPPASHPVLGSAFAVATNGSEPTTDQVAVTSGSATSARVFAEPDPARFLARARPRLRVAPVASGPGRALVLPVDRMVVAADGAATMQTLRVLPVDLFANVADVGAPMAVTLAMTGAASIVVPDSDGNPQAETLSLIDARGVAITIDDAGSGRATLVVSAAGAAAAAVEIAVGSASDSDGDGAPDDGNASAIGGDRPCDGASAGCDDNCPSIVNPSQFDSDHDGLGDCCDGACVLDPAAAGCGECASPVVPNVARLTGASVSVRLGGSTDDDDRVRIKLAFDLPPGAELHPDAETVAVAALQAGSGFTAALDGAFTDVSRGAPSYRYVDRSGSAGGVVKAQMKGTPDGGTGSSWRMIVKARGPSIADPLSGNATLSLTVGDDVIEGGLACEPSGARVSCSLTP